MLLLPFVRKFLLLTRVFGSCGRSSTNTVQYVTVYMSVQMNLYMSINVKT